MAMYTGQVCDIHIHVSIPQDMDIIASRMKQHGYAKYCLLGCGSYYPRAKGVSNVLGLLQKLRDPSVYVFASLEHPETGTASAESLLEQVKMYHAVGFDGVKMIEGKPNVRLRTGVPLDDAVYEPMLGFLEAHDIPVLSHVNDPRFFWDITKMSPAQIARGWYAGPDNPSFETVRAEALETMRRHPGLRTTFAHFFFASGSTDEADGILDRYPNVNFDLTPGTHYADMSSARDEWRTFMIRRSNRLLFGTDNAAATSEAHTPLCRQILETADEIEYRGVSLRCFELPEAALADIYAKNFDRFAGASPRPVDRERLSSYIQWTSDLMEGAQYASDIRADLTALNKSL
ncbi:MAG: amidohydrolase family protein [Eubacteriales bacterium]|jgi:predicted TIM-barrel fold metal-dependent hydrolase